MSVFYFGIIWDKYTTSVKSQLVRDIIAMQNHRPDAELVCCCKLNDADRVLNSFNIKRTTNNKAKLYILYSTTPNIFIEAPEDTSVVILRNLEVTIDEGNLDPNPKVGYYLQPGDRAGNNSSPSSKAAPNSYAPADPTIKLRFG